jgi:hypothetical protein
LPPERSTWIASHAVFALSLMKRVSSTARTRYGPICRAAMPRLASSFARKSVVSRRPRAETSWPVASARVPGGMRISGSARAIVEHNTSPAAMTRRTKHRNMTAMRNALIMLSLTLVLGGCGKKDKDKPSTTGSGSAVMGSGSDTMGSGSAMAGSDTAGSGSAMAGSGSDMAGSGSAMAGSGSGASEVDMAKKAGNCPSTVYLSTTKAEIKGKDVVLTITSDDKDAIGAIQRRTAELLKEKAEGGTGAAHDQKGTHGGGMGLCPVFFGEGGKAKSVKVAKGVAITITPKDKPDELKKVIDERIAKSTEFVKTNVKPGDAGNMGGVGGGSGDHGSTHKGSGDAHGKERGKDGTGGGAGTGGGGGKGTGGGSGKDDKKGQGGKGA